MPVCAGAVAPEVPRALVQTMGTAGL